MSSEFLLLLILCFVLKQAIAIRCFSCIGNSINDTTQSCTQTCQSNFACYFQLSYASIDDHAAAGIHQTQQLSGAAPSNQLEQALVPMEMISYGCAETAAGVAGSGCVGNAQQQGFICYCSTDACNNPIVNTMGRMKRQAKSRKEKRRARRTTNKKRSVRKARRDGKTEIPFSAIPNDQQRQKRTKKSLRKRSYLMRRPSTVNIQSNESRPSEDDQVVPTLAAPIGPSNRKKRSFLPTGQARLVDTADHDEKGEQVNISHVRAPRNVNMDILLPPAANDRVYVKGVKPKGKNLSQQKTNEQMSTKAVGADLGNEENDYDANSDVSLEDDNFDSEDYSYMDGYESVEEPSDQAVEIELTPVIADLNKMNTTTRIVQNDATIGKEPPHLSVLNGILISLLNSNETVNLDDPQNIAKDVLTGMVQN